VPVFVWPWNRLDNGLVPSERERDHAPLG
jgi:hypothetical protein